MEISDYSELENEITNAPEPKTLEAGTEVKVRITSVFSKISDKNGVRWFMPVFDVPDDFLVEEFRGFFWDLKKETANGTYGEDGMGLSVGQYAKNLRSFRDFAQCFNIDLSRPFSWEEDLNGKEGWVIVGLKIDPEYGEQNNIKTYIAGR